VRWKFAAAWAWVRFTTEKRLQCILTLICVQISTNQGGMFLAEWCLHNEHILLNKNILELGCGCGFTGLAVAKSLDVASYTFTDAHPDVLRSLESNVAINRLDPGCVFCASTFCLPFFARFDLDIFCEISSLSFLRSVRLDNHVPKQQQCSFLMRSWTQASSVYAFIGPYL